MGGYGSDPGGICQGFSVQLCGTETRGSGCGLQGKTQERITGERERENSNTEVSVHRSCLVRRPNLLNLEQLPHGQAGGASWRLDGLVSTEVISAQPTAGNSWSCVRGV